MSVGSFTQYRRLCYIKNDKDVDIDYSSSFEYINHCILIDDFQVIYSSTKTQTLSIRIVKKKELAYSLHELLTLIPCINTAINFRYI